MHPQLPEKSHVPSKLPWPPKSAPLRPNSSFARSQGSRGNGAGKSQRLGRLFLRTTLLNPVSGCLLRVLSAPVRLRSLPPGRLALRLSSCLLAPFHSRIGIEPLPTDRTRSLPQPRYAETSSCPSMPLCLRHMTRVTFSEHRRITSGECRSLWVRSLPKRRAPSAVSQLPSLTPNFLGPLLSGCWVPTLG